MTSKCWIQWYESLHTILRTWELAIVNNLFTNPLGSNEMSCQEGRRKSLWIGSSGELRWAPKKLERNKVDFCFPKSKNSCCLKWWSESTWPLQRTIPHTVLHLGSVFLLGATQPHGPPYHSAGEAVVKLPPWLFSSSQLYACWVKDYILFVVTEPTIK